jgi:hypothetical protein
MRRSAWEGERQAFGARLQIIEARAKPASRLHVVLKHLFMGSNHRRNLAHAGQSVLQCRSPDALSAIRFRTSRPTAFNWVTRAPRCIATTF